MAVDTLRLDEVLKQADLVQKRLQRLRTDSASTAQALESTGKRLQELQRRQAMVGEFRELRPALEDTNLKLAAARARMMALVTAQSTARTTTKAQRQELALAVQESTRLAQQQREQQTRLQGLREGLRATGMDTRNLSRHDRALRADLAATTAQMQRHNAVAAATAQRRAGIDAMTARGKALAERGKALSEAGGTVLAPARSVVQAQMAYEQPAAQLGATMAGQDGKPAAAYQEVMNLAKNLATALPGSTAEFIGMMDALQRQGVSARDVLAGVGEQSARLGLVLGTSAKDSAEFAAQLQQATGASADDMAALADTVQRAAGLKLDPAQMLKGLDAIGKALPQLGQQGARSGQMFAPLLLLLDQAGIGGKVAGDALAQMLKRGMDPKGLAGINKKLATENISLDFSDAQGRFGGTDQLMAQLDKLKGMKNTGLRDQALASLAGGDKQTLQALQALMQQGPAGLQAVAAQMAAQASLEQRVALRLDTVAAQYEAARDSYNGLLGDMGETIAPDVKGLLGTLREMTEGLRGWVREHPEIVKWSLRLVAVVGLMLSGLGLLASVVGGILGPIAMARAVMPMLAAGARLVAGAFSVLMGGVGMLGSMLRVVFASLLANPLAMVGLGLIGFLTSLFNSWSQITAAFQKGDWSAIGGILLQALMSALNTATLGLLGAIQSMVATVFNLLRSLFQALDWAAVGSAILNGLAAGLEMAAQGLLAVLQGLGNLVITAVRQLFGINSPSTVFAEIGGFLIEGLIAGLAERAAALRDGVVGVATSIGSWFKETFSFGGPDATSPSPPLPEQGRAGALRQGIAAAATAATLATGSMPALAAQGTVRIDSRAPLAGAAAPPPAPVPMAGATIHITVNAAPGQDAQAIARAVAAELDRRERARRSSVLSQLSDID